MRKFVSDFIHRGLVACGFGPVVLAILYLILQKQGVIEVLTVNEVCAGIFSIAALAFLAGGMNAVYQIEKLPLTIAILLHGGVLYISYLGTYLVNGWLEWGKASILTFSGIFLIVYLVIWVIIYVTTKKRTERINEILKDKQKGSIAKY